MAVDWSIFHSAVEFSRAGENVRALAVLSDLLLQAESETDKAAIMLGQSSCYCNARDMPKSFELLASAKKLAQGNRGLMLQIATSEGSLYTLNGEHEHACRQFASIKAEYADLLVEDKESEVELDSRFACALVSAHRFEEAIPLFERLFERKEPMDTQWLQLFFGLALANTGRAKEAQSHFLSASQGKNKDHAATALTYLSGGEKPQ